MARSRRTRALNVHHPVRERTCGIEVDGQPRPCPSAIAVHDAGLWAAPRNLTNNPGQDTQPAWSPDSKRLVFTRFFATNFDLYVIGSHGSGERVLTATQQQREFQPAWSPDGKRILGRNLLVGVAERYAASNKLLGGVDGAELRIGARLQQLLVVEGELADEDGECPGRRGDSAASSEDRRLVLLKVAVIRKRQTRRRRRSCSRVVSF